MFNNDMKYKETILQLKAEVSTLEGSVKNLKEQVEFWKERGDRYFNMMNINETQSIELVKLAKEILCKAMDPKEITKFIESSK